MTTPDRRVPIELVVYDQPHEGTALVVDRGPAARARRAVVALFACWGIGVCCVFIPVLHFVLVPGFLVGGIALAVLRATERTSLVGVEGACPRCKRPRTFEAGGRFRVGAKIYCDGCGNHLELRLPAAGSA